MTPADADAFAREWLDAWNARDLDAILVHYAEDVVFLSPVAARALGDGRVVGKESLRAYWRDRLAAQPALRFELRAVLVGHACLTILYRNHRAQDVAETFEVDAAGLVTRAFACYR